MIKIIINLKSTLSLVIIMILHIITTVLLIYNEINYIVIKKLAYILYLIATELLLLWLLKLK